MFPLLGFAPCNPLGMVGADCWFFLGLMGELEGLRSIHVVCPPVSSLACNLWNELYICKTLVLSTGSGSAFSGGMGVTAADSSLNLHLIKRTYLGLAQAYLS